MISEGGLLLQRAGISRFNGNEERKMAALPQRSALRKQTRLASFLSHAKTHPM